MHQFLALPPNTTNLWAAARRPTQCGQSYSIVPTVPCPSILVRINLAGDRLEMEHFLSKAKRLGYHPANQASVMTMVGASSRCLLRALDIRNNHVASFLPAIQYNLRPWSRNFKLSAK